MPNHTKHNVSDKELDNLLSQAFLNLDFTNPKNEELMETISQEVMQPKSAYITIINKSLFTKITGVVLFTITAISIYLLFFNPTNNHLKQENSIALKTNNSPDIKPENPEQENQLTLNTSSNSEASKENTISSSEQKPEDKNTGTITEQTDNTKTTNNFTEEKPSKIEDTSYVFPKLTEKEIKENNRQKLNMSMMLVKPNKYWYPLIGSKQSKAVYGNASDTNSVFYIARSEVTNLEYRTFLFDLLIHDQKEAFLIAKPHQELWLSAPGNVQRTKMKNEYFSDKHYNDYPVVNITPEGAELYCKWLIKINKQEDSQISARLPYENEWIKAARSEKNVSVYPWGSDSIQNKRGCHLANFCIKKLSDQLKTNMECTPKNKNAYASAEFMLGDSMMTCKVSSYNPNDNGLYCISGNVAEMVYDNKTKTVKTKGGSWNSDFEHCKINSSEELSGAVKANSMTGFRPIFRIVLKNNFGALERIDPNTGLTTLTPTEIKNTEKEKKKMIESVIKFDRSNYSYIPMGTCIYKNEAVSVQSFYMQTTEVTNLQYRTFLADLLIQGRNDDYLIAKPDQKMWVTKFPYSYNEPMTNMYFWHPAYDDYPVVNISRKAAEMYCNWLTIETNKVLKENNKPLINDLRIPVDIEWAYAATNGKNQVRYANGAESLKDAKEKYMVNYSCYYMNECRYDSTMNLYVPQSAKKPNDRESKERNLISDGAFHTAYAKSYTPNTYGLYCMGGNAAEMVNTFDTKTKTISGKGTKGGSWFSCDHFLEINSEEEYPNELNASPLIGFRPVFTAPKK